MGAYVTMKYPSLGQVREGRDDVVGARKENPWMKLNQFHKVDHYIIQWLSHGICLDKK